MQNKGDGQDVLSTACFNLSFMFCKVVYDMMHLILHESYELIEISQTL